MVGLAQQHAVGERDAHPHQREGGDRERSERPVDGAAQRQPRESERQAGDERAEQRLAPAHERDHRQRGDRHVPEPRRRCRPPGQRVKLGERQRAEDPERQGECEIAHHDDRDGHARGW